MDVAARDAQITHLRAQGLTLQAVADAVGLTRERVRQILKRDGGPDTDAARASQRESRQRKREALQRLVAIDLHAHPASTAEEVACRLGCSREEVLSHLADDVRALLLRPAGTSLVVWTDEASLAALRDAATYAYPLTTAAYNRLLQAGEVQGPSVPRIFQRFGSWNEACKLAGVEPSSRRRPHYQSRWTDDDILGFVRQYLESGAGGGTFAGYDGWRRLAGFDAPSSALMRQRLGPWSDVKRRALQG